ncbi:MAG TPA: ester cyclase [Miltoncostaeaceae bacterium]|nr:ester cyclase [Miltoncostaeaceae bacterium]
MIANSAGALAVRGIELFNAADWGGLRELCAADVVYTETGTSRRLEGMDACDAAWHAWRTAMPDLTGTVLRTLEDGDVAAIEIRWVGTQTGPLPTPDGEIPPTGRRIEVLSTQWVTARDGHTAVIDHHLDLLGMLGQLGVLGG